MTTLTSVVSVCDSADLPRRVEIRGEVYISRADFAALNAERKVSEVKPVDAFRRQAKIGSHREWPSPGKEADPSCAVLSGDWKRLRSSPLFSNPRNAASGALRQLDPAQTASRGLGEAID